MGREAAWSWIQDDLDDWNEAGLKRARRAVWRPRPGWIGADGREFVDFASNDYLGLAADRRVADAVIAFLRAEGWGAGASPLITGLHPEHEQLEQELATFEGVERVLLLGSGFAANFGAISALADASAIVFSEARNHASLIDGCRRSRATVRLFEGGRLERLEAMLHDSAGFGRRIIVTDSVFSMDGDLAPLPDLCALADRFEAVLYVDEAHATGVLGKSGRGAAEHFGVEDRVPIRMGTLSKALGSIGGFLATDRAWHEWFIQRVRPYVFSTAIPAAAAVAGRAALGILRSEPWRGALVQSLAGRLREGLIDQGHDVGQSQTPILPIIVGDPEPTLALAQALRARGYWTGAIRPPTVPPNTARLRVSVSAAHGNEQVDRFLSDLKSVLVRGAGQVSERPRPRRAGARSTS